MSSSQSSPAACLYLTCSCACQAFSLESKHVAVAASHLAGMYLSVACLGDGTSTSQLMRLPSVRPEDQPRFSQLRWTSRRGKPTLLWAETVHTPALMHEFHSKLDEVGCDLWVLTVCVPLEGLFARWAPSGEMLCLAAVNAPVWEVPSGTATGPQWARCIAFKVSSNMLLAWRPSSEHLLVVSSDAQRSVRLFRSSPCELVSKEYHSFVACTVGLEWSSTGIVALSQPLQLCLCTVAGDPPTLQLLHRLYPAAFILSMQLAPCGWLLALAVCPLELGQGHRSCLLLVDASTGTLAPLLPLSPNSAAATSGPDQSPVLAWAPDSSCMHVCGPVCGSADSPDSPLQWPVRTVSLQEPGPAVSELSSRLSMTVLAREQIIT